MEDSKNKKTSADNSKRKTRKQIEKKLETTLSNLRPVLGNKKFKRRVKKAAKLLSSGLKNFKSNGTVKIKNVESSVNTIKDASEE
jgi:hypothetical protein